MIAMAGVTSVRSRIDTHCTVFITAQRKKQRLHLRKSVCGARCARAFASSSCINVDVMQSSSSPFTQHRAKHARVKSYDETSVSCAFDHVTQIKKARRNSERIRKILTDDASDHPAIDRENFCTGSAVAGSRSTESIKNERIGCL